MIVRTQLPRLGSGLLPGVSAHRLVHESGKDAAVLNVEAPSPCGAKDLTHRHHVVRSPNR